MWESKYSQYEDRANSVTIAVTHVSLAVGEMHGYVAFDNAAVVVAEQDEEVVWPGMLTTAEIKMEGGAPTFMYFAHSADIRPRG